jgi:hypothetical protein
MKKLFTSLIFTGIILISLSALAVPKLNSFPTATATIFLDFDGQYVQGTIWNNGNPINCAASGMTDVQITEAFNRVAEDFRPFNINITTDSTVFLAAPLSMRIRIIVTTTSSWATPLNITGTAFIGSFIWGDDTPAFVFTDRLGTGNTKKIAEITAHECGHTVGLDHQTKYNATCGLLEEYNAGFGSGETGWAPIMGNSLSRNFSNWNDGPTPNGCTWVEDNLTIITTQNGFGYRTDDFAETLNGSTYTPPGNNFNVNGIISTNTDKDAFKFTLSSNSNFHLTATPYSVAANSSGANLDIAFELYSSPTNRIRTYNPMTTLHVTADTILNAGTYYIKVMGGGNSNIGSYGSLGSYNITGSFSGLPIHDVKLNGTAEKNKHNLNWNIIADEPIKTIEIQTANDGTSFNALTSVAAAATKFSYQPFKNNTVFYRLKVTSVLNQVVFSNTIALKATGTDENFFSVSTLVQQDVTVNAADKYQYTLSDMNGKKITAGNGLKGMNHINVSNLSRGMYIIQLFNNNQRQTERIIKQ